MKIINADVQFITPIDGDIILKRIEECGRVAYKSEKNITTDSAKQFVANLIKRGHESVLEHCSFTVKFICDRGVSHELVRHRLAAYTQESTRYCNYSKDSFGNEITVIKPCFFNGVDDSLDIDSLNDDRIRRLPKREACYGYWYIACENAEYAYFEMLNSGATPQEARSVLPNSLKTEVNMTANLREWRHFFKLRCAPDAHPQMREVAIKLLHMCQEKIPVIFDDIPY